MQSSDGYSPAAIWLTRDGMPMTSKAWQSVFNRANRRCREMGLDLYCTPHVLRHTFAVNMLEQLQRGHNEMLGSRDKQQRRHYQMAFGDPLNFLRIMLGHRSIETTSVYLHAMSAIELEAKLHLLGDSWDATADSTANTRIEERS